MKTWGAGRRRRAAALEPRRKINMRGLEAELRELERTNPEVKAAAENYERVRDEIITRGKGGS